MSRLIVFSPKTYTKEFRSRFRSTEYQRHPLFSTDLSRKPQNQEASSHNLRTERKKNKQTRADRKEFPAGKLEPPKKFMRKKWQQQPKKQKERKKERKLGNLTTCWGKGCKKSSGCWPNSATAWFPPSSMPACGAIACACLATTTVQCEESSCEKLFCFPRRRRRRKKCSAPFLPRRRRLLLPRRRLSVPFVVRMRFLSAHSLLPFLSCSSSPGSRSLLRSHEFLHTPCVLFFFFFFFFARFSFPSAFSIPITPFLQVRRRLFFDYFSFPSSFSCVSFSTYSFAPVSSPASRSLRRSLMIGNE